MRASTKIKKSKAEKTRTAAKATSAVNAVKTALKSISTKIDNAVIIAYKTVNDTTIVDCLKQYNQFTKDIIISRYDCIEFGAMSIDDFKKEINSMSRNVLRNYATAILLCIRFSIKFETVTSKQLQALFFELTKQNASALPQFSGTSFHFGLHGNCKYKTSETKPDKQGKQVDSVAVNLFNTYPLAIKSAKIFTKIEAGNYYPIPTLAPLYCLIANSLSQEHVKVLFEIFVSKCFNDKEKVLMLTK